MSYLFWFIASAVLMIIELLTTSLMFASFSLGALLAGIGGLLGFDFIGTGLTFALTSILAVMLLRPVINKRFVTRNSQHSTNVLALVGAEATTTTETSPVGGQVKVRGEVWSAKTDSETVNTGETVTITDIDGVTLVVKPNKQNASSSTTK